MDTRSPIPGKRQDRTATKATLAAFDAAEDAIRADIETRRRRRAFVTVCIVANLLFATMLGLLVWSLNS